MIKILQKVGIEGTYLNIIKAIYDKPTANIVLNGEKLKPFLLRSGTRQGCKLSPLLVNIVWCFSHSNQRRKTNKRNPNQKRSKAVTVCRWHDTTENAKASTRKLLELISEFGKVAGYKINVQKSLVFLYTNDEKSEREIKETLPFTTATKRITYLWTNLPKEQKTCMQKTIRHWSKKLKMIQTDGEIYHVLGLEE